MSLPLLILTVAALGQPPQAPPAAPPVRFAALGDTGLGNADQRAVADALASVCGDRGCDFVLLLGDNVYPRGMTAPDDPRIDALITEMYADVGVPFYSVLGNHDWMGDPASGRWQVAWAQDHPFVRMPDRYYTFRHGEVGFYGLDTTPLVRGTDPAQADWLAETLSRSDARWKVVFGHHPLRSEGRHGNAGRYLGPLSLLPGVRNGRPLREVLEQTVCPHADLYVSGHDHLLQWLRHCGTDLIVSGAGAELRGRVKRGNEAVFLGESLGFAWIELSDEMTVAFFNEKGQALFEQRRAPSAGDLPETQADAPSGSDPGDGTERR